MRWGTIVKIDELIQEIIENVAGLEACCLLNNRGDIVFPEMVKKSHNSLQVTSLLLKTIIESHLETYFSTIELIKLEGITKKLILYYFPHQNIYISIIGSRTMASGIVQIYINKMKEVLDKEWKS